MADTLAFCAIIFEMSINDPLTAYLLILNTGFLFREHSSCVMFSIVPTTILLGHSVRGPPTLAIEILFFFYLFGNARTNHNTLFLYPCFFHDLVKISLLMGS